MDPVNLDQVPADDIKEFVSHPGNKLADAWFWCPECGSFEQHTEPVKPSPEADNLTAMVESVFGMW